MITVSRIDRMKADLSGCPIEITMFYMIWQREVWPRFGLKSFKEVKDNVKTFIRQLRTADQVMPKGHVYINVSTKEFIAAAHRATSMCNNLGIEVEINL